MYRGGATETSHHALWNEMVEWLMQAFDELTSDPGSGSVPVLLGVPEQSEELKSSHE